MAYNPRARLTKFQSGHKMSKNRYAWARVTWGLVAVMFYPDPPTELEEEEEEEGVQSGATSEPGPTVRLLITKNKRARPTTLDLTMLSEQELECLKKAFDLAFEEAKPVCRLRDQEAAKRHAEGDDSNHRIYRPVPQFIVRERPISKHAESLRDRPDGLPRGDGDGVPDTGVREPGDDLADPQP